MCEEARTWRGYRASGRSWVDGGSCWLGRVMGVGREVRIFFGNKW